jgi:hypothetical protein
MDPGLHCIALRPTCQTAGCGRAASGMSHTVCFVSCIRFCIFSHPLLYLFLYPFHADFLYGEEIQEAFGGSMRLWRDRAVSFLVVRETGFEPQYMRQDQRISGPA